MKKIFYLFTAASLLTACNSGNSSYTITGSVEGASDGDSVYLQQKVGNRQLVRLNSAAISNGKFTIKGEQDSTINCYLTYNAPGKEALMMDFFLENGKIDIELTHNNDVATGTPNNDAYQEIRAQLNDLNRQLTVTFSALGDTALTAEQRQQRQKEMEEIQEKMMKVTIDGIKKNIANAVGIHLLKQNFIYMDVDDLEPLMSQIPANYANDAGIVRLKDNVARLRTTAVGQKFTDFNMITPEGLSVKLSDYVGKGQVVLVDFWASWCGPCRREIPHILDLYERNKKAGFVVVGVSLDHTLEDWQKGIERLGITWPQMSDLKFWNSEGARLYAVSSIPHTVLIDGEGTIIARGLDGKDLDEAVAKALNNK